MAYLTYKLIKQGENRPAYNHKEENYMETAFNVNCLFFALGIAVDVILSAFTLAVMTLIHNESEGGE